MLNFLLSLSLGSGAILIGASSAFLAFLFAFIPFTKLRWFFALVMPFVLSYSLYWWPVWLGQDPSEYYSWALVAIVPWYAVGVIASVLIVVLTRKFILKRHFSEAKE